MGPRERISLPLTLKIFLNFFVVLYNFHDKLARRLILVLILAFDEYVSHMVEASGALSIAFNLFV